MDTWMPYRPCLDCGVPCRGPRCPSCRSTKARRVLSGRKPSASARGYDSAWRKLSARAIRMQPWCSSCFATDDLTLDHSAEAWAARDAGQVITPDMVLVLCRKCNSAKGAARTLNGTNSRTQAGDTGTGGHGPTRGQGLPDTLGNAPARGARRRRVS